MKQNRFALLEDEYYALEDCISSLSMVGLLCGEARQLSPAATGKELSSFFSVIAERLSAVHAAVGRRYNKKRAKRLPPTKAEPATQQDSGLHARNLHAMIDKAIAEGVYPPHLRFSLVDAASFGEEHLRTYIEAAEEAKREMSA